MVAGRLCFIRCSAQPAQPAKLEPLAPAVSAGVRANAIDEIRGNCCRAAARQVIQFFFYEQWHALRFYCAQRSIRVVGDIAIFVDYDSADVWSRRELYRLREDLEPEVVSGFPPMHSALPVSAGAIRSTTGMLCVHKAMTGG